MQKRLNRVGFCNAPTVTMSRYGMVAKIREVYEFGAQKIIFRAMIKLKTENPLVVGGIARLMEG